MGSRDAAWNSDAAGAPVQRPAASAHSGAVASLQQQERLAAAVWSMLDPHLLLRAVRDEADQLMDLTVVDANEEACSEFGLGRDELLGCFLGELPAPGGRWRLFSGCMDTMRTGQSLVADDAPYRQPGDLREARLDVRAVRVGGDHVSVTWRDVTARFEAARELEGQRSLLRATLDSELDPHVVISAVRDGAGRIVDFQHVAANPVALAYLGVSEQAFGEMRLREVFRSDAASVLVSLYAHTVTTGEPLVVDDFAYPNELFGGEERRYDLRGARLGDGISLTWRDVTDRHRDRMALAESEARFRNAMASASIGMCLVGPDGTFLQVNQSLCDLLGRGESELLAATWQQLTHPDDIAGDLQLLREVLDGTRESYRLRKRYLRPDGTVVHGDLSVGCVRDSAGEVRHLVSQIVDVTRQVQAEEALAASRDEYRLVAEHATDVVYRTDGQGVITWVSDSVYRVLGYQPEQLIGRPGGDFIDPEDQAVADSAFPNLSSGQDLEARLRLIAADGSSRWVRAVGHQVLDPDGAVLGVVGGWQDIDSEYSATLARARAQAALADSEARYRMLAEHSSDVIAQIDLDGFIRWLSPAVQDMAGFRPAELVGHHAAELVHPDDLPGFRADWASALAGTGQAALRLRLRLRRADGSYLWVSAAGKPVPGDGNGPGYRVVRLRDVSAEVAAEQALAKSRDEYRLLAEHATDVVFRSDNEGTLLWLSDSVNRVLGRQPAELTGRPFLELVHPDDADRVRAAEEQFAAGADASFEGRLATADGGWRWVAITAHPVRDDDGVVVGRAGGWRDVTAQVLAGQELQRSFQRLGEALEAQADPQAIHEAVRDRAGQVVDLRFVAVNAAMCRHLGKPREQVVGQLLTQVQPQTDPARIAQYARVIETGEPLEWNEVEFDSYTTGEHKIVDFRCYKVGDGLSMAFRDITARVLAQRGLAAAEARYRSLARSAAVGLLVVQAGGRIVETNDAACELTGLSRQDLLDATWADLTHPDERSVDLTALDQQLAGERDTFRRATRLVRGDDAVVWVDLSVAAVRTPEGAVGYLIAQVIDITEAVAAQEELAVSEQRYRMLAEYSADVILQVGADGRIWWASPSASESIGWQPGSVVGRSVADLVSQDDAEAVRASCQPGSDSADAGELTLSVRQGDGSLRWMQLTATEVPAVGNRQAFHVVRLRDAHAQVQARRELAAERSLLADTLDAMVDPHLILQPLRSGAGEVDMVCLQVNPAAVEYLGSVTRRELLGHGLLEVLDVRARQLVSWCAQVAETGEPLVLESVPFRAPGSGAERFITVRITRVGPAVAASWSDVTDAHLAAGRLARSEARYRLLADNSGDVVVSTDPAGHLTYVSPAVSAVLGWQPEDLLSRPMRDLVHPDDLAAVLSAVQQLRDGVEHPGAMRGRLRRADGTYVWISSVGRSVTDESGVQIGVVATWRDIRAEVAAQQQTEAERSRLAAVLDSELEPRVYLEAVRDPAGEIVDFIYRDVNDAARDYLKRPLDPLEGARLAEPMAGPTGPEMLALYAAALSGEPLVLDDFAVPGEGAAARRFDIRAVRVGDGISLAWRDVTDRFRDAQDLAESRQKYRLLAENATDAVFRADGRGVLTFVTPGVTTILGLTPDQVVGRALVDLVHPEDQAQLARDLPEQRGPWPRRVRMLHASGGLVWVEVNAAGVCDAGDAAIVGGWHDVTAEVAALESLRRQARTDGLTGLSNRAEAISQLAHILGHAPRTGQQVAALFCDLDGLKRANDSEGHAAGNTLITTAAQRIAGAVRSSDLVARFGGDEFLVVLTGLHGRDEALAIAEKIRSAMSQPVVGDGGRPLATTMSIGVAMAALGDDVDSLVARADAAMYAAKRAGGDAVKAGTGHP